MDDVIKITNYIDNSKKVFDYKKKCKLIIKIH